MVDFNKKLQEMDLTARLNASLAKAAPSLNPRRPKADDLVVVPDIREIITAPADLLKISRLISQSAIWAAQKSEADKNRKPLIAQIKDIVGKYNNGKTLKFISNGAPISYYNSPRSKINAQKLLAHGIAPAVIADCTDVTDCWQLRITGEKEDNDE